MTALVDLLRHPVVAAPMAGGPTTVELVVAAGEAGALGLVAGGYKSAGALGEELGEVRRRSPHPFGVNLFVPGAPAADVEAVAAYLRSLQADAAAVGVALGEAAWDDDGWDDKVQLLVGDPPPVVSFTFGCPPPAVVTALQAAGSLVLASVTSPPEAAAAAAAGADAVCVQGIEAGGHRASFSDAGPGGLAVLDLIAAVKAVTDLPQVAAGGIMGPSQVRQALQAGAVAVQCGTAFLRSAESGAQRLHQQALADPSATTAMTRAFSGRWARGIANRFVTDHGDAPAGYPELNNATRPLRRAAAAQGDTDRMSLWAGTGFALARPWPAARVVEHLCGDLP